MARASHTSTPLWAPVNGRRLATALLLVGPVLGGVLGLSGGAAAETASVLAAARVVAGAQPLRADALAAACLERLEQAPARILVLTDEGGAIRASLLRSPLRPVAPQPIAGVSPEAAEDAQRAPRPPGSAGTTVNETGTTGAETNDFATARAETNDSGTARPAPIGPLPPRVVLVIEYVAN